MADDPRSLVPTSFFKRLTQARHYNLSGGWFSPERPLVPQQPATAGRALDYLSGYNISTRARRDSGIDFQMLRNFSQGYDILRIIIEKRMDQISTYDWSVVPLDEVVKSGQDTQELKERAAAAQKFLKYPDGVTPWVTWLRKVINDMLTLDAICFWPVYQGKQLLRLESVDPATIKIVIDESGRVAQPPDPAYQQILHGVPASEYMIDELLYFISNPASNRVYGFSKVEQIIVTAQIGLRRELSQLQFFTDGNVPAAIAGVPDTWSMDQIAVLQEAFDALLAGNTAARRKLWFIPGAASDIKELKSEEATLKASFDEWLVRIICFTFGIAPTPFVNQVNRATAETASEEAREEGLGPTLQFLKSVMDAIITKGLKLEGVEFKWGIQEDADPAVQAAVDDKKLRNGSVSINELRQRDGLNPIEGGDMHYVYLPTGPIPVSAIAKNAEATQQAKTNPPAPEAADVNKPPPKKDDKESRIESRAASDKEEVSTDQSKGHDGKGLEATKGASLGSDRPFALGKARKGTITKLAKDIKPRVAPLKANLTRDLQKIGEQVAKKAWPKVKKYVSKLAKQGSSQDLLASIEKEYNLTIELDKDDKIPKGPVLSLLDSVLGDLCRAGEVIDTAVKSFTLDNIYLEAGRYLHEGGWHKNAIANYKPDTATIYIGADTAVKEPSGPLTLGVGKHNVGTDFRTVFAHEVGHLIMPFVEEIINQKIAIIFDSKPKTYWADTISKYAAENDQEMFAEAFAAYTHRDYIDGTLPIMEGVFTLAGIKPRAVRKAGKKKPSANVIGVTTDSTQQAFDSSDIDGILDVIEDADWAVIQGTITDDLTATFKDAGMSELAATGNDSDEGMFNSLDTAAAKYAEERSAQLVTDLSDSTREMLQGTIVDALKEGWSQKELSDEISKSYAFGEARADTIAHTELAAAHVNGHYQSALDAGATGKIWLLSDDHDIDDECNDNADEGEIGVHEDWASGDDLPPSHPNCLCDIAFTYGSSDEEDDDDSDKIDTGELRKDTAGHEFHGNQYTGGIGGAHFVPDPASKTPVKDKVYSLMQHGQAFTIEQMQAATGKSPEKIAGVMNYMTTAWAAKKYGCTVVKQADGSYKITQGPHLGTGTSVQETAGTKEISVGKEPGGETKDIGTATKPEGTSVTKEQADANYKTSINTALNNLKNSAGQKEDLQKFKDAKAVAMSQWQADVQGGEPQPIKDQVVYPADVKLAGNLKSGMDPEKAYSQWKQDTAAEKAAGVKPYGSVSTPPSEPKVAETMKPTGVSEGKYDIVPSGYQQIGKEDVELGKDGESKLEKGMNSLKNALQADSKDTWGNKAAVQSRLANELKNSPNFQALKIASGDKADTPQQQTLESKLVSTWAETSGDSNSTAVAIQLAARDAFKMSNGQISTKALESLSAGEEKVFQSAAARLTGNPNNGDLVRAGMQEFVHGMYRTTQEYLAEKGITDVYVARGMKTGGKEDGLVSVKMQPISSFSASVTTASAFKGTKTNGRLFLAKVPASQVLSTYLTGFGCTGEHEVTVLSHSSMKMIRIKSSPYSARLAAEHSLKAFNWDIKTP